MSSTPLIQLAYASRPFGYDDGTLIGILGKSRLNNERDGISGSLICRDDLFLQLLEGPEDVVDRAYNRIAQDERHIDVQPILRTGMDARMFGDWAMRHDPARSWMWSHAEVAKGALARATPDEVMGIFARLAHQKDDDLSATSGSAGSCPHHH